MDGNGRWATARSLPRVAGHQRGAEAVRRTVEAAPGLGIGTLTLYAFSSDNWRRPAEEVSALMGLLDRFLRQETERCVREGVRVQFIGRRDRLPGWLRERVEASEAATRAGGKLHLRIAVDYSSRDAILGAVGQWRKRRAPTREEFSRLVGPDVDLLIRTSGEQRLSDFLLWECAYAEFFFTPRLWPDFRGADLAQCVQEFRARDRRFGAIQQAV